MAERARSRFQLWLLLSGLILAAGCVIALLALLILPKSNEALYAPASSLTTDTTQTQTQPEDPSRGTPIALGATLSLGERTFIGNGNPAAAPPELIAVLGETRWRVYSWPGQPAHSPDGKWLAVPSGHEVFVFDCASGAMVQRLVGHTKTVLCVAFRPDSRQLASGSEDQSVRLWNLDTGLQVPMAMGHSHHICGLAFSPDGKRLVSAGLDRNVYMWNLDTGKPLYVCKDHTSWVHSVAFHPGGAVFASGSDDHTLRVWDAKTGKLLHTLSHHNAGSHLSVAYCPDGKQLAGGSDTQLRLWDATTYSLLHTVDTAASVVAFHPDKKTLLTGSLVHAPGERQLVRRWELNPINERQTIELGTRGRMAMWDLSPDGKTLAAIGYPEERALRLIDVESGKPVEPVEAGHLTQVECILFSPDGKTMFSCSADRTIRIWNVADGKWIRTLQGHTGQVRGLALSPDGKTLASSSHDRTVRLWDVTKGVVLDILEGHGTMVESVAWSPDGTVIAAGGERGTVSLWDAATRQRRWLKTSPTGMVEGVCFTSDNQQLLCSGDNGLTVRDVSSGDVLDTLAAKSRVFVPTFLADGYRVAAGGINGDVTIWSLRTGAVESEFPVGMGTIHQVAVHGKLMATAGQDGTVRVWDRSSEPPRCRPLILRPWGNWMSAVQFSPDGRLLAVGMPEGTIALFRVPALPARQDYMTELVRFEKHTHIWLETCAVLPDGKRAVSGGFDNKLFLWDLETGEELRCIEGHKGGIASVALLAGGKRALTGSADNTLRVWDLETGEQLQLLEGHTGMVRKVGVSADGRWAASVSEDRTVRLWDLDSGKQAKQFNGHTDAVRSVAISPDGKRILSGSEDHTVRLWDVESGKQLRKWEAFTGGIWAIAFSPDGKQAVWGDGAGGVWRWDVETGSMLGRWHTGSDTVRGIAYSPNGQHVLAGDSGGSVVLIDLTTGQVRDRVQRAAASTLAWTPDGHGAITTHADKKVRVWRMPAPPVEIVPLPAD